MFLKESILNKLKKQDIDQEVKQSAIIAIAQLMLVAHKELKNETDLILQILGERLSNELTREAALKALALLAG